MQWKSLTVLMVAGLFAAGCGGCSPASPTDKDGKPKPGGGQTPGGGTGAQLGKPDFSLPAPEYAEDVRKNYKPGANNPVVARYKGKVVEINGFVGHYAFRPPGTERPGFLVFGNAEGKGPYVYCWTADPKPWDKATPGQAVKVKGNFVNDTLAMLEQCGIEEVTGPAAPALTPDELTGEFARDAAAARRKYQGKSLILTGDVDKVAEDRANGGAVTFKTAAAGPRVVCRLLTDYNPSLPGLKPGHKLKVIGGFKSADRDRVELGECVLMK